MSILLFLLVLFVLILVHELGHFFVAKWTGMRVDEFGIGFPPKLWGYKKGETEYTFNALPIGGFVRILGENFDEEEITGDYERSFVAKSRLAQAAVLIAGVTMNVLFAWLLFVVVFVAGVPTAVSTEEATDAARLQVTQVVADSPAAAAGLTAGSEIVAVATEDAVLEQPLTPERVSEFVAAHGGEELVLTYVEGGETRTTQVTPEIGVIEGSTIPQIGISQVLVETVQQPLPEAVVSATSRTAQMLVAITVGITTLLADAVQFNADFSSVAGPVGIVGLVEDAAEFGFTSLLLFTAFISLNLAIINLLPFPALDGGRLLFVAIESVIRRPLNPVWLARLNLVGFMLLILLMVAVTVSDVTKLL